MKLPNEIDGFSIHYNLPNGIPVATVAIGKALNAGLLAIRMLAINDSDLNNKLNAYHLTMVEDSRKKANNLN